MKTRRGASALLTALGGLLIAPPLFAQAQPPPRLEHLEVAIWPEYDQPAALVMLSAFLAPETPLPTSVPVPIPARVAIPSAVATRAPDGSLVLANYKREQADDGSVLRVETDALEIRVEYYVALVRDQNQRRFDFEWPGGLDIERVTFEAQQPVGTSAFSSFPPPSSSGQGSDGLTYYHADVGPKSADEQFVLTVAYTKSGSRLSTSAPPDLGSAVGGASDEETGSQPIGRRASGWLAPLAIVVALGLIVLWLVKRRRKATAA